MDNLSSFFSSSSSSTSSIDDGDDACFQHNGGQNHYYYTDKRRKTRCTTTPDVVDSTTNNVRKPVKRRRKDVDLRGDDDRHDDVKKKKKSVKQRKTTVRGGRSAKKVTTRDDVKGGGVGGVGEDDDDGGGGDVVGGCTSADEMVSAACLNIHNAGSIDKMEWSEAVLLCLASPQSHGELHRLAWPTVQKICIENEWGVHITSALRQYGRNVTLRSLLTLNRRAKITSGRIVTESMFCTAPRVNMKMLKKYVPVVQLDARKKVLKSFTCNNNNTAPRYGVYRRSPR